MDKKLKEKELAFTIYEVFLNIILIVLIITIVVLHIKVDGKLEILSYICLVNTFYYLYRLFRVRKFRREASKVGMTVTQYIDAGNKL